MPVGRCEPQRTGGLSPATAVPAAETPSQACPLPRPGFLRQQQRLFPRPASSSPGPGSAGTGASSRANDMDLTTTLCAVADLLTTQDESCQRGLLWTSGEPSLAVSASRGFSGWPGPWPAGAAQALQWVEAGTAEGQGCWCDSCSVDSSLASLVSRGSHSPSHTLTG